MNKRNNTIIQKCPPREERAKTAQSRGVRSSETVMPKKAADQQTERYQTFLDGRKTEQDDRLAQRIDRKRCGKQGGILRRGRHDLRARSVYQLR